MAAFTFGDKKRPCIITYGNGREHKALFHCWGNVNGNTYAIVECEDGAINLENPYETYITFLDSEFDLYSFEPRKPLS